MVEPKNSTALSPPASPRPRGLTPTGVPRPKKNRAKVSNGRALYLKLKEGQEYNANSAYARRLRDLINAFVSDLGGVDACSEAERALIRRAAVLIHQMEILEASWTQNGGAASEKSLIVYQRCTGALRRYLRDLGLKRRPRDVSPPHLDHYLTAKRNSGENAGRPANSSNEENADADDAA
jgi:hypothetical protein